MRGLMMRMKSALVGLMMGGLSAMIRDWPDGVTLTTTPIEKAIRQVKRASRYHPTFNGSQPLVKRAQRQAVRQRSRRRARRLGHG